MNLSDEFEEAIDSLENEIKNENYEKLRLEFTKTLLTNNDLLHERSFAEICRLGKSFTDEYIALCQNLKQVQG